MTPHAHLDARTLRSRLNHPVIDADGHWIEYSPVMREEFKRIGGAAAEEALALSMQRVPNALKMSVGERQRRRGGPGGVLGPTPRRVSGRGPPPLPRAAFATSRARL